LPLYIYQALPSVAIFGLNEFAVRFPGALFGTLTVVMVYFLVREVVQTAVRKSKNSVNRLLVRWLPLASAAMLGVMPWHIHFSRGVFGQESLFWVTLGVWLSLLALRMGRTNYWILSFLSFSTALLTYHSPRVFVPLWTGYVLLLVFKKRGLGSAIKVGFIGFLISGCLWIYLTTSPLGMARAAGVSVFSEHSGVMAKLSTTLVEVRDQPLWLTRSLHNKVESFGRDLLQRYFSHFNLNFLFFDGDPLRPRYRVPNAGQLLLITLPFYLLGLYVGVRKRLWPILVFLVLAPLPPAFSIAIPCRA